jgi:hypothetical protein
MKKYLILSVALLLCTNFLPAQDLNAYTAVNAGYMWFSYPCTGLFPPSGCRDKEDLVKAEYPPWIIGGGWRTYYLVDGIGTSVASHPASMVTASEIDFKNGGGDPVRIATPSGCQNNVHQDGQIEPWRLQYYGAYSAQYINHPTAGTVNLAFVEGENYSQSDKWLDVGCAGNGWNSHSTFLCGEWIPNNQSTNWGQQYFPNHMGPIIWPATGYFTASGLKSGHGCANNATIQADDGYLYVFYKDHSEYDIGINMEPGRLPGIKVARVPIHDALNPLAYRTFYEDANGIHWNLSMPAGFNKNNIVSFYTSLGPQGSLLLEGDRDYTRFAVARVAGTNYYLGVGSYPDPDPAHRWLDADGDWVSPQVTNLKFSYDLLHWFGDRTIDIADSWKTGHFNYPIFLSADGWTNTSIDVDNFYVVGTNNHPRVGNAVYRKRIYIPAPPPPPPPVCYDQWGNQVLCPPVCYDNFGHIIDCSNQVREATPGTPEVLDNSKERAPFVYPNPGPGVFRLNYSLKGHATTQLNVLDLTGRRVQTGAAVSRMAGTYMETVNISGHAKGVYLLELLVNGGKQTFKVICQ